MNLKARFWLLSLALVSTLVLSGCGGGGTTGGGGGGGVTINALDTLKFDPATASIATGGQVIIKNTGAQQHNWVLVKPEDADRVATESLAKGGDATGVAGVLSGGKMIAAAGSETLTVSAPAGSYTYICTVAGHYPAGMKGTLTSQ
jgi:plastocyanin